VQNLRRIERRKKEKETIVGAKPMAIMIYVSHHRVKGSKIFQTSSWKAAFGGRTTSHAPFERCMDCPHVGACSRASILFFK